MQVAVIADSATRPLNWCRWVYLAVLVVLLFSLVPAGLVLADELGGLNGEELIDMSGVADSDLLIGMSPTTAGSLYDIEIGAPDHYNPSSPAFQLNGLIPLVLMGMLILIMLKALASGDFSMFTLIVVAVMLYIFYAMFPGIQQLITGLLGGG